MTWINFTAPLPGVTIFGSSFAQAGMDAREVARTVDLDATHHKKDSTMPRPINKTLATGSVVFAIVGISPAFAQTTAFIDFENSPVIAKGPSIYVAVPAQQTIVTPEATFSGGVVLGLATFFPAIAFASSPNVYGTADFGNNLARTLTIDLHPSTPGNQVNQVSFALFNGETFNQSYQVDAFNGSTLLTSQTLASVAPNFNSGYGIINLASAANITQVTINAVGNPTFYDFLIDDVAINQSLTNVITTPLPPVIQPPTPPVIVEITNNITVLDNNGHKQKRKGRQSVHVDFGDDINDIRGPVLLDQAVPAVPEPSVWAMMLAGFGLIGVVVRRRTLQNPMA
jgi:hypothetical protein